MKIITTKLKHCYILTGHFTCGHGNPHNNKISA